eukprot:GHVP01040226.1.p1 GENE.GHVP01040226.1~~GHVP01040226.1.p1  ORF type:complete len:779 (-),score=171.25 GHVP01040226.1:149-2449(-)
MDTAMGKTTKFTLTLPSRDGQAKCPICSVWNSVDEEVCPSCEYRYPKGNASNAPPTFEPGSRLCFDFQNAPPNVPVVPTFRALDAAAPTGFKFASATSPTKEAPAPTGFQFGAAASAPPIPSGFSIPVGFPGLRKATAEEMEEMAVSAPAYESAPSEGLPIDQWGKIELPSSVPALEKVPTGIIYTWGSNECDQLPVKKSFLNDIGAAPVPCQLKGLKNVTFTKVTCGALHSLALTNEGVLYSWGCSDDGALGRSGSESSAMQVPIGCTIVDISCGDSHSAAVASNGDLFVWGSFRDNNGVIGMLDAENSVQNNLSVPTKVPNLPGLAQKISSGPNHIAVTCAGKQKDEKVVCVFGNNSNGELGYEEEDKFKALAPQIVDFSKISPKGKILDVFCVSRGTFVTISEPRNKSFVFASGFNGCGELALNLEIEMVTKWRKIEALDGIKVQKIAGCDNAVILLTQDGKVLSWGHPEYAGRGEQKDRRKPLTPMEVPGLHSVQSLACGGRSTYCLTSQGVLVVWGDNQVFQLGDGADPQDPVYDPIILPSKLFDKKFVCGIAAGSQHGLAMVWSGQYASEAKELRTTTRVKRTREEDVEVVEKRRKPLTLSASQDDVKKSKKVIEQETAEAQKCHDSTEKKETKDKKESTDKKASTEKKASTAESKEKKASADKKESTDSSKTTKAVPVPRRSKKNEDLSIPVRRSQRLAALQDASPKSPKSKSPKLSKSPTSPKSNRDKPVRTNLSIKKEELVTKPTAKKLRGRSRKPE